MDVTSINLGKQVRNDLREYRDRHEFRNYNEAVRALIEEAADESAPEISS
jgi:Arc/MetJ-type ribon-helix-helix transcriptional regulator